MLTAEKTPPRERTFDLEFAFTAAYRRHQNAHPAIREARCLEAQFPAAFLPVEDGDLFAGRVRYGAVGFSPQQSISAGEVTGYYCDPGPIEAALKLDDLPPDTREKLVDLLTFWKKETTVAKLHAAFTPFMRETLSNDDWQHNPGVIFPLYRMAGASLDFDQLLRLGIPGLIQRVQDRRARETDHTELFDAMLIALDRLKISALSLAQQVEEQREQNPDPVRRKQRHRIMESLLAITEAPPQTLHQAIQLMVLYSTHSQIYGSFGRMDVYFADFYAADLAAGRITRDEGIAMLVSLFRILGEVQGSFLASINTRVIVGGKGRRNESAADEMALLIMDAVHVHRNLYPQLSLRFYLGMNPALYQRGLDRIGEGLTFPILYNDDVNIPAVQQAFGVDQAMAEQYVPFGCGEYIIDHASFGTPNSIINVAKALEIALRNGIDPMTNQQMGLALGTLDSFPTFEALFDAYRRQIEYFTQIAADFQMLEYQIVAQDAAFLYFSMLYDDCIERGKAIFSGGIRHLGGTFETYGNITAADSLTAIKRFVYDTKQIAPHSLLKAVDENFHDHEEIHSLLIDAPRFGNDDDEADTMAQRVHNLLCETTRRQSLRTDLDSYLVVVINNSAHVILGRYTCASADGRRAYTPLTNGNTATNGMDQNGITALLNSIVKLDPAIHAGATHNLKLSPVLFTTYRPQLQALLKTYFERGGTQTMITVVNRDDLLNALKNPDKYRNLIVRVGGFSARFVELAPDIQQEIINRTLWA